MIRVGRPRERDVKADILDRFGARADLVLWNNPTGVAQSLSGTHKIRFGLVGSADILGVRAIVITEAHLGLRLGQALAIETKRPKGGRWDIQQQRFARAFEARGGLYLLAPTVEAVVQALG